MAYLIFGDVHANTVALNALQDALKRTQLLYDEVICLGDLTGRFYDPVGVWKTVTEISHHCILGNHDEVLVHLLRGDVESLDPYMSAIYAIFDLYHAVLMRKAGMKEEVLAQWEKHRDEGWMEISKVDGLRVVLAHGAPPWKENAEELTPSILRTKYLLPHTNDLGRVLKLQRKRSDTGTIVFVGHTHLTLLVSLNGESPHYKKVNYWDLGERKPAPVKIREMLEQEEKVILVNPGSVGAAKQTKQVISQALAHAVWLDPDAGEMFFLAVPYEIEAVERAMEGLQLPSQCFEEEDYRLAHQMLRKLYRQMDEDGRQKLEKRLDAINEPACVDINKSMAGLKRRYDDVREVVPDLVDCLWLRARQDVIEGLKHPIERVKQLFILWDDKGVHPT